MPLTAQHATHGRIDITQLDHATWEEIYRPAAAAPLTCNECASPMLAKEGSRRRHFAHRAGHGLARVSCSLVNESAEHLAVKNLILDAVRGVDKWEATPEHSEHTPEDDPLRWQADVLATGPGRRIAWEVQFSDIKPVESVERTRRHAISGVETVWINLHATKVLAHVPAVRAKHRPDVTLTYPHVWQGFRWTPKSTSLGHFVRQVCEGRLVELGRMWVCPDDIEKREDDILRQATASAIGAIRDNIQDETERVRTTLAQMLHEHDLPYLRAIDHIERATDAQVERGTGLIYAAVQRLTYGRDQERHAAAVAEREWLQMLDRAYLDHARYLRGEHHGLTWDREIKRWVHRNGAPGTYLAIPNARYRGEPPLHRPRVCPTCGCESVATIDGRCLACRAGVSA